MEPEKVPASSEHIRGLSEIDRDVAKLLQAAGLAIQSLTTAASRLDSGDKVSVISVDEQKSRFTSETGQYFALLASIDSRLRTQIQDLEGAEIIVAEPSQKESQLSLGVSSAVEDPPDQQSSSTATTQARGSRIKNPGDLLGRLDVSWLNSRNNHVGQEKEAELWEKANSLLSQVESKDVAAQEDLSRLSQDEVSITQGL